MFGISDEVMQQESVLNDYSFVCLLFSFRCTVKNRPINIQTALWKSTLKLTPELWTHNCLSHFWLQMSHFYQYQHTPTRLYDNYGSFNYFYSCNRFPINVICMCFLVVILFLTTKEPKHTQNSWSIVYQSNNIKRAATVGILRCCRCVCVCVFLSTSACVFSIYCINPTF